ncbi:hypothetical protein Val02_78590 [Virgisporangium aliadipatigenens]|uniref:Uncharacterized protein n=1 Tax=Virgisporangium aliadipatigenens TaxID=741659 RepID=A0A8J3YUX3_9ACTN|nr:hypothetical protein Val02_78590 [Virgisporangium aliadipatigenens]
MRYWCIDNRGDYQTLCTEILQTNSNANDITESHPGYTCDAQDQAHTIHVISLLAWDQTHDRSNEKFLYR